MSFKSVQSIRVELTPCVCFVASSRFSAMHAPPWQLERHLSGCCGDLSSGLASIKTSNRLLGCEDHEVLGSSVRIPM